MGRRQFWRWVDQINTEVEAQRTHADSWAGAANDPNWQAMRDKRERWRGR